MKGAFIGTDLRRGTAPATCRVKRVAQALARSVLVSDVTLDAMKGRSARPHLRWNALCAITWHASWTW
jgi:hypothetical protein